MRMKRRLYWRIDSIDSGYLGIVFIGAEHMISSSIHISHIHGSHIDLPPIWRLGNSWRVS